MFDKIYDSIVVIGSLLIGIALIVFQIMSYIGNIYAGVDIPFLTSFDIFFFLGYNIMGIIGLIFLVKGIVSVRPIIIDLINKFNSASATNKENNNEETSAD